LCLNQAIYETTIDKALNFSDIGSFDKIIEMTANNEPILVLLGSGIHKIKKKAEQRACADALYLLQQNEHN